MQYYLTSGKISVIYPKKYKGKTICFIDGNFLCSLTGIESDFNFANTIRSLLFFVVGEGCAVGGRGRGAGGGACGTRGYAFLNFQVVPREQPQQNHMLSPAINMVGHFRQFPNQALLSFHLTGASISHFGLGHSKSMFFNCVHYNRLKHMNLVRLCGAIPITFLQDTSISSTLNLKCAQLCMYTQKAMLPSANYYQFKAQETLLLGWENLTAFPFKASDHVTSTCSYIVPSFSNYTGL